jgi:SAM-dependent methyltransferase
MPITAFGAAMIASLHGRPQTCAPGEGGPIDCGDYLTPRDEEVALLGRIAPGTPGPVLDIGCGVGRHLAVLRAARPDLLLLGAEICDAMRDHCSQVIDRPTEFSAVWRDLLPEGGLGLVLLMGNGLGALGDEVSARRDLAVLARALRPGGRLLVETGLPFAGRGYVTGRFSLRWKGQVDDFDWGHADAAWVREELAGLGLAVEIHPSRAPHGQGWFIAEATKP